MTDTQLAPPAGSLPEDPEAILQALSAPFDAPEVKFKPAVVSGNRALALPYVDARVIQDRLDEVLGIAGWQDEFEFLPDGSCLCRLRLRIGGEWLVKMDVGGPSEQPDEGDRRKAAVSDALKRAAVKFGVGRYLYRLPSQWCDYDPHKRQFTRPPALPVAALPPRQAPPQPRAAAGPKTSPPQKGPPLPADGAELERQLDVRDQALAARGLCNRGYLSQAVVQYGRGKGYPYDVARWNREQIADAVGYARELIGGLEKGAQRPQEKPP